MDDALRNGARAGRVERVRAMLARELAAIFSPPALPSRLEAAVRELEAQAEILVGWVQLCGVALFAALYLATRGAFAQTMGLEPVPVALGLYAAFTLARLRLAYLRRLGPAVLTLSSSLDVVLLMLTIWSFTLQYHEPPALYLKAPTLLYVFIVIALRALRFDARQLVLTGLLAATGWMALVGFAAYGPEPAPVTDFYPDYMTSLSLLWGAELDKVVSILAVTLVLTVAVTRTRGLLVRMVAEGTAAADLSRFLDRDAAARIRGAETAIAAGDGELREAAIVFVDLRGFTPATRDMPPKDVIALLKEYHAAFLPVIEAAGGSIDKFMGDGILVSFGAARRSPTPAADALRAVDRLIEAADAWARARAEADAVPLGVAFAIATGPVVYGAVGHGGRLEFTVIGDAVNLAAKLEKHAKSEKARAIATREAFERAVAEGYAGRPLRTVDRARVEGAPAPIDLAILR
ncbi:MAG: adenylate/guanylate cyclase domain-containing protein [Alphaproteobacteria bacterium]|nr:adenylate/guanylate cyclase domain-containing protein [Alphaproteobacteria bacterium]